MMLRVGLAGAGELIPPADATIEVERVRASTGDADLGAAAPGGRGRRAARRRRGLAELWRWRITPLAASLRAPRPRLPVIVEPDPTGADHADRLSRGSPSPAVIARSTASGRPPFRHAGEGSHRHSAHGGRPRPGRRDRGRRRGGRCVQCPQGSPGRASAAGALDLYRRKTPTVEGIPLPDPRDTRELAVADDRPMTVSRRNLSMSYRTCTKHHCGHDHALTRLLVAAHRSYRITFLASWPALPADRESNLTLPFGHTDDTYTNTGRGGYHALIRPDGDCS